MKLIDRDLFMRTSSGWHLPLNISVHEIQKDQIISNAKMTSGLCKAGCKMYGKRGGCPPFAPDFDKAYRNRFSRFFIVINQAEVAKWESVNVKNLGHINKRMAMVSTFVEVMIKSLEKNQVKILKQYTGRAFPSSWCNLCHKCAVKIGNPCAKPKERLFSVEACGILVDNTLKNIGLQLYWFDFKNQKMPPYCRKVLMFASDADFPTESFINEVCKLHNIRNIKRSPTK